jgi:hypothetical protein
MCNHVQTGKAPAHADGLCIGCWSIAQLQQVLEVQEGGGSVQGSAPVEVQPPPALVEPAPKVCARPGCGNALVGLTPSILFRQKYCSVWCRYQDTKQDFDDWVLETIVEYKAANDGCAPTLPTIAKRTGLSRRAAQNTIHRLQAAGRIKLIGKAPYRGIVVPGGKWVYEAQQTA